jgi:hypothetical protein
LPTLYVALRQAAKLLLVMVPHPPHPSLSARQATRHAASSLVTATASGHPGFLPMSRFRASAGSRHASFANTEPSRTRRDRRTPLQPTRAAYLHTARSKTPYRSLTGAGLTHKPILEHLKFLLLYSDSTPGQDRASTGPLVKPQYVNIISPRT